MGSERQVVQRQEEISEAVRVQRQDVLQGRFHGNASWKSRLVFEVDADL